ncbi:MAG TPA: hypothetical protein VKQ71_03640 [Acidimicrobiales bacterium]|nr:hypothetical protein [Acidimicrobiales bacterium]
MAGRRIIKNQRLAFWTGVAMTLAGSVILYDALEARGQRRPWLVHLLPGA